MQQGMGLEQKQFLLIIPNYEFEKEETKTKSLEQENKLLKQKLEEKIENQLSKKQNQSIQKNTIDNIKKVSLIDAALEQVETKEIPTQKEDKNIDKTQLDPEQVEVKEESKKEEKPKIEKVDNEIKQNQEIKEKNEQVTPKVNLTFNDNLNTFCKQFKHQYVLDIIHFVVSYDTNSCQKFVIYDKNVGCILINTYWFIYKLSLLIKNENERETFLDTIFSDRKKGFIANDFLSEIIKKINSSSAFKFGARILYQEKKDDKILNFKSAKIRNKEEGKLYQGTFLYMYVKSQDFKEALNKDKILDKIYENSYEVEITDESGIKITIEEVKSI